ncbi:MAG: hypothetical protein ACJAXQ_001383 [Parvibaculaceae bacterium]|jgi:hypothetical protein|tara:strand:+ start:756 stop:920 length:165 start_codon:yes stop_codon:yes gene_type:complete
MQFSLFGAVSDISCDQLVIENEGGPRLPQAYGEIFDLPTFGLSAGAKECGFRPL